MKCDNCSNDAIYLVAPISANAVNYCAACLPPFLRNDANAGLYDIPAPAPAPSKKKADPAPSTDTPDAPSA